MISVIFHNLLIIFLDFDFFYENSPHNAVARTAILYGQTLGTLYIILRGHILYGQTLETHLTVLLVCCAAINFMVNCLRWKLIIEYYRAAIYFMAKHLG